MVIHTISKNKIIVSKTKFLEKIKTYCLFISINIIVPIVYTAFYW